MTTQPCLPGSNNQHTAPGRAIDTWDREFNGSDGSGCYEAHERVDPTKLTGAGYTRDGFVVDDADSEAELVFLPPTDDECGAMYVENAACQATLDKKVDKEDTSDEGDTSDKEDSSSEGDTSGEEDSSSEWDPDDEDSSVAEDSD